MKKLNYRDYLNHYDSVLRAYKNCSQAKLRAEDEILEMMMECGGHSYRVLSKNCFQFTAAFLKDIISEETGEILYTEVHYFSRTRWNSIWNVELEF
ncbi:MAG: hypothetical protein J6T10_25535 [Methanobrevibacter sp.]|nr:hypothetical protein [Methanobrevibacter sp.]